jgi:membrane protein
MAAATEAKNGDQNANAAESRAGERSGKMSFIDVAKETFKEFKDDRVTDIAAGVAYHAIFAIPPMIVFVVSLAALINQVTDVPVADNLRGIIDRSAPGETRVLLNDLVDKAVENVSGGQAIFSIVIAMLIALWSGSNGVATVMKAFNRAYDVAEDRTFIKQKAVSIGLTVLIGVMVIAAFGLFVFGEQIGAKVADWLGLGNAFELVWGILRWPAAIVFIMFLLAVLYYLGPNIEQSFRWISPGSVLATVLWIVIALGFSFYVNVANPGSAYGAVGSVVVLLFYLYVSSIAFILGAELNSVLQRRFDEKTVEDLAQHPGKVEGVENQVVAQRRAERLDQREGTNTSAGMPPTPTIQPVRSDPPVQRTQPGLGARAMGYVGSLILALIISRLRRPSRS